MILFAHLLPFGILGIMLQILFFKEPTWWNGGNMELLIKKERKKKSLWLFNPCDQLRIIEPLSSSYLIPVFEGCRKNVYEMVKGKHLEKGLAQNIN